MCVCHGGHSAVEVRQSWIQGRASAASGGKRGARVVRWGRARSWSPKGCPTARSGAPRGQVLWAESSSPQCYFLSRACPHAPARSAGVYGRARSIRLRVARVARPACARDGVRVVPFTRASSTSSSSYVGRVTGPDSHCAQVSAARPFVVGAQLVGHPETWADSDAA